MANLICYNCGKKMGKVDCAEDSHGLCKKCFKKAMAETKKIVAERKKAKDDHPTASDAN